MRPLTREQLRQRKTKIYIVTTIAICASLIIYAMFTPAAKHKSESTNEIVVDVQLGNNFTPINMLTTQVQQAHPIDINKVYVEMLAKVTWGEARGCSKTEQAAVMWCVLNRVDSDNPDFRDTVAQVIGQPDQFHYKGTFPLEDDLLELANDVLTRWYREKETGELDSGRVLPKEYCFFHGDGKHNYFRDAYEFEDANFWDWSWDSPYEE